MRRRISFTLVIIGLTLSIWPGSTATAAADPADNALVQTTCSYDQLHSALSAEAPDLAQQLDEYPQAQAKIREMLALPVDQRSQRIRQRLAQNPDWQAKLDEKRATPDGQQKLAIMDRVAATCHNY